MAAYYNEHDAYAAAWLRNLIAAGHIAAGDVDERSIADVRAADLAEYEQCHFFAGIGGWSLALRLAAWPDDRPVWTGSCPCQPFSAAGAGKAADDERHLWPVWFPLIAERRPAIVFGEQVEAAIGWGWLDAVFADLEAEGYACGATVLPACGVGAPHIRQRVWFVADAQREAAERQRSDMAGTAGRAEGEARERERLRLDARTDGIDGRLADADGGHASAEGLQRGGQHGQRAQDGGAVRLADPAEFRRDGTRRRQSREPQEEGRLLEPAGDRPSRGGVADTLPAGRSEGWTGAGGGSLAGSGWSDCDWLPCTDGRARPVEPGTFPLAHGIPGRVGRLRAYGNAITPQVAAEFIAAATE